MTAASRVRMGASNASYRQTILGLSPWAYWPLQETSGTTVADLSGNGRTGTIVSGVTLAQDGPLGGVAAEFFGSVGSNQSSTGINVASIFPLSGAWTVTGWCRIPTDGNQPILLGTGTIVAGAGDYWSLYNRPTTATGGEGFKVLNRNSATTAFQPSGSVTQIPFNTSWHHWAVAKPSGVTATQTFYIDGVAAHTAAASATNGSLASLRIGGLEKLNDAYALTGRLAHLSIHTTELSAGVIAVLASATG